MKIVIAFDSFKGTIRAGRACQIAAQVIAEHAPAVRVVIKPMADGGEGTAEAMLASAPGRWLRRRVTGPLPNTRVEAGFAWFPGTRTALIEMASASGLQLLSPRQYNPMKTTTYGTGQLIKAAIKYQPRKILLAVGGSATVDGGIGAAAALGWTFLNKKGTPVPLTGAGLPHIASIIEPRKPIPTKVEVLCDVDNPLCGRHGAARIYGPQKGATPRMVERLEKGLENLARLVKSQIAKDIDVPGAGAAGGLAAGALAFMNAALVSGPKTVINFTRLADELADADWIITGEGCFDRQSLYGKVVSAVAEAAAHFHVPVAVIAGQVRLSKASYRKMGIRTAIACKPPRMSLDAALANSADLLRKAAKRFVRQNPI
ncbi:MAG TPA: glycerate kinase [Sedimentisphaerales bacterium]|nr:glycerate kinase [Sedimentisphaerales bacterium]